MIPGGSDRIQDADELIPRAASTPFKRPLPSLMPIQWALLEDDRAALGGADGTRVWRGAARGAGRRTAISSSFLKHQHGPRHGQRHGAEHSVLQTSSISPVHPKCNPPPPRSLRQPCLVIARHWRHAITLCFQNRPENKEKRLATRADRGGQGGGPAPLHSNNLIISAALSPVRSNPLQPAIPRVRAVHSMGPGHGPGRGKYSEKGSSIIMPKMLGRMKVVTISWLACTDDYQRD